MELKEVLQSRIDELSENGDYYCECVKPFFRERIYNPILLEQGTNLFLVAQDGSKLLNVNQYDETKIEQKE